MAKILLGNVADIPENTSKVFDIEGRQIAVFNVGGKFYGIDNRCPHKGTGLADGHVENNTVTCPGHGWVFSLETGEHEIMPVAVKTYRLIIEDKKIFTEL